MGDDELRTELLDAATRVFARQGYEGTRIGDIVRESGLSTGAVYGRFRSKNDLLREAVVRSAAIDPGVTDRAERVADVLMRGSARFDAPLTMAEAIRLEAHVVARREPEVARAIDEANERRRESFESLVRQALADGTFADDLDPEALLYFIQTVGLGLLLQRAAGAKAPDAAGWADLIGRILASVGRPAADPTRSTSTPPRSTT